MQPNNSLSLPPVATVFFLAGRLPTGMAAATDLERGQRLAGMNPLSGQIEVTSANHYFDGADEELSCVINKWLDQIPRQDCCF